MYCGWQTHSTNAYSRASTRPPRNCLPVDNFESFFQTSIKVTLKKRQKKISLFISRNHYNFLKVTLSEEQKLKKWMLRQRHPDRNLLQGKLCIRTSFYASELLRQLCCSQDRNSWYRLLSCDIRDACRTKKNWVVSDNKQIRVSGTFSMRLLLQRDRSANTEASAGASAVGHFVTCSRSSRCLKTHLYHIFV